MSIRDTSTPLSTSETSHEHCFDFSTCCLHRTVPLSVGAREHCSWHRRSTPLEAYSCWDDTLSLPRGTHHIYMSGQFCLLILYLVAICQMSSGPHGPIFLYQWMDVLFQSPGQLWQISIFPNVRNATKLEKYIKQMVFCQRVLHG